MIGQELGPYRILREIGRGGTSVVYEAMHKTIGQRVAIKQLLIRLPADARKRAMREARALGMVEHAGLVRVIDCLELADGTPCLVLELLEGRLLRRQLGSPLPLATVLHVGIQLASALAATHRHGIVHRDMKPDNLMLVRDPIAPGGERVKILDFGIAKLMKSGAKRTATSAVMGTPLYMSPEQCRGAGEVDERSDVYSLGVVLYEMLAGRCPFDAEGGGEVLGMHLFKEPPPLSSFAPAAPTELVALTHRMLVKDKDARPQMAAVVSELARIGAKVPGAGIVAPPDGDATVMSSLAFDATARQGRSSTLGRSAGERVPVGRRVRLLGGLIGGALFLLSGLLWLALRKPAVPTGPIHSLPVSASSPADRSLTGHTDHVVDGGGTDTQTVPSSPSSQASAPPADHPSAGSSRDHKVAPSFPTTRPRPKSQPARKKSAFSDVD